MNFKPGDRVSLMGKISNVWGSGLCDVDLDGFYDVISINPEFIRPLRKRKQRVTWETMAWSVDSSNFGYLEGGQCKELAKWSGKKVKVTVELLEDEK